MDLLGILYKEQKYMFVLHYKGIFNQTDNWYYTCRKPSIDTDWTVFPRPISSAKMTFVSFLQLQMQ
jgi:hypothetical protein